MPAFEYAALDASGKTRKGVLEGDTPRQARQQLRDQGLTPLRVEEVAQRVEGGGRVHRMGLGSADLALLTRQLATLVRSGLALEEALDVMARQATKPRLRRLLMAVRSRVLEGHALADGLAEFPRVFSPMYRATVAAGEQSGHLDLVLDRLAEYTENRRLMQQKTLLALFYPLMLTGIALLVVSGLLAFVVPKVVKVFVNLHQELPLLTRILIALGEFFQQWGWALLLGIIAGITGFRWWLRHEKALFWFHGWLLRLPILGRIELGSNTARLARTLSILLSSGVPLVEALGIASEVVSNRPLQAAVREAAQRVREGSTLHHALEQSGRFPPMAVYLIAGGENAGNLETMLERAAVYQEQELEGVTAMFLGLFEPLLILFMGAVVLIIVLAILLPVFELNQLVR